MVSVTKMNYKTIENEFFKALQEKSALTLNVGNDGTYSYNLRLENNSLLIEQVEDIFYNFGKTYVINQFNINLDTDEDSIRADINMALIETINQLIFW